MQYTLRARIAEVHELTDTSAEGTELAPWLINDNFLGNCHTAAVLNFT